MKFKNSYKFISINTNYWRPGINLLKTIIDNLDNKLYDEDIIIFSEKALSIALGRIIDEKNIKPSLLAKFLARVWMRIVWGYFLSIVCFLKKKNILRLRNYPIEYGAYHKQVALSYVGFLESLRHFSEGGIDASNLPYTYVSLPLRNPDKLTNKIKEEIFKKTGKNIGVIIIDGDSTFNFKNFYFSPRKTKIKNLKYFTGFFSFIIGRFFKLERHATPLAISNVNLDFNLIIKIVDKANKLMGHGAGETVWDMAKKFKVKPYEITWEMLEKVKHKPIIICRFKRK